MYSTIIFIKILIESSINLFLIIDKKILLNFFINIFTYFPPIRYIRFYIIKYHCIYFISIHTSLFTVFKYGFKGFCFWIFGLKGLLLLIYFLLFSRILSYRCGFKIISGLNPSFVNGCIFWVILFFVPYLHDWNNKKSCNNFEYCGWLIFHPVLPTN